MQGCDMIGREKTWKGKTLAFGIPIMDKITKCNAKHGLSHSKGRNHLHSLDWSAFSTFHTDLMISDVIAPSPWTIFGCKNVKKSKLSVKMVSHKPKTLASGTGSDRFEGVEEKLNKLLDVDGGISKWKMELLFFTWQNG